MLNQIKAMFSLTAVIMLSICLYTMRVEGASAGGQAIVSLALVLNLVNVYIRLIRNVK